MPSWGNTIIPCRGEMLYYIRDWGDFGGRHLLPARGKDPNRGLYVFLHPSLHTFNRFFRQAGVSRVGSMGGSLEKKLEGGGTIFLHFLCVFRAFQAILNFEIFNFRDFPNWSEGGVSKIVSGRGLPSPRPSPYWMYASWAADHAFCLRRRFCFCHICQNYFIYKPI